jgi:hypothetical protein
MPYIAVMSSMQEAGLEYFGEKIYCIVRKLPLNQAAVAENT